MIKALILEKRQKWLTGKTKKPTSALNSTGNTVGTDLSTLSSAEWIQLKGSYSHCKHNHLTMSHVLVFAGLAARKLSFYDVLKPYVFRHASGEVRRVSDELSNSS